MKLSLNWLRDYIDPKLSTEALVERLTMAGLEVEGVENIGGDTVLEIEITPNRPDCLNILGLAREIGAITGKPVKNPKAKIFKTSVLKNLIHIENKKDCSRYIGTLIQGPSALWSLGAQAAELLFDAGQRHALTQQARHTYEANAAAYRSTVIAAFQDIEDQLSGLRILEQESTVEQRAVESAQRSYDLSNQRYKGGVTSYLEVLTAEATLLQNQRTATDLTTRQFVASVGLVRSLGGGWDATQLPK